MRRAAPAATLRVDAATVGPYGRVERGPTGLRLVPVEPPGEAERAPGAPMRLAAGTPFPAHEVAVVAAGKLVLAVGRGVAASLRAPELHLIHDRRPPGLDRAVGAPLANAGLLHADAGWRAVVLPSLGDIVADLGPGPVASRADGRRLATVRDGGIEELEVGQEGVAGRREGAPDVLAYAADGSLVVAAGSAVGPPGTAAAAGSAVVAMAAAPLAPLVLARHEDGVLSVWGADGRGPLASWGAPIPAVAVMSLSADGELAALGSGPGEPPAACVVRARDGALVRYIEGARAIALSPADDGLVLGGDWGCAWMKPIEEEE